MKLPIDPKERKESCESHGEYASKNVLGNIWTKCPVCTKAEIAEDGKKEWIKRLNKAGIDRRYHQTTLKSYKATTKDQKAALEAACTFADNYPDFRRQWHPMAFLGSPGCGKTHLAAGVAIRVISKHNGGVLMVKSSGIAAAVKETFNSSGSEKAVVDRFARVGLLIIDEICEDISDFDRRILFDVIDKRYSLELPMIVISNLDADRFEKAVGERAYDRLRENHVYVPFCWKSYR